MSDKNDSPMSAGELLESLRLPRTIDSCELGIGTYVTIRLAPKTSADAARVWIRAASWLLAEHGSVVVGSEDYREDMKAALDRLAHHEMNAIRSIDDGPDIEIVFADGWALYLFQDASVGNDKPVSITVSGAEPISIGWGGPGAPRENRNGQ
jgi:hypothetical protein